MTNLTFFENRAIYKKM